jgi:integrase
VVWVASSEVLRQAKKVKSSGKRKRTRTRVEPGIYKTEYGRYEVIFRDAANKQRSKFCDRLVDARNLKAQIRLKKQRGDSVDPDRGKMLFATWANEYLNQKVALEDRTRDKYASSLSNHLVPEFGRLPLRAITCEHVQDWIIAFTRSEYRAGATYKPETVRGHYDLFSSIMKRAVDRGHISRSPCLNIELPAILKEEQRYLTEGEVERLVHATDIRYRMLVLTAAYLGLRWQELAGLKPESLLLDQDRPSLRVVHTVKRSNGRYRVAAHGKSRAARRTLKMPAFLADGLRWHLRSFSTEEWVFPAPEGGHLRYDNFKRVWKPAVDAAGIGHLTIHELRHTAAAFMINDGADPLQVKRRMGHEDIRTTFNTYGHLFPDREDDLVDGLERRRTGVADRWDADLTLTPGLASVTELDAANALSRENEVDQRRFELLTSPVRGVRSTN